MKLSIVISSNRPQFWRRFANHVSKNSIETEIIICGPLADPDVPWPVTTRFIQSDSCPAMCWALAARAARGDLLCLTADDVIYSHHCFDTAVEAMTKVGEYDSVAPHYFSNHQDFFKDMRMLSIPSMPLLPIIGIIRTAAYHKLGGIDRQYRAVLWDVDVYARLYEIGGRTALIDGHTSHELDDNSQMFAKYHQYDKEVLKRHWLKNGNYTMVRNSPAEPYSIEEVGPILYRS